MRGIGEDIFNDTARFASGGRLQSVEMFYGTNLATNRTSAHEVAHQWGSYIDWTRLKGLTRAGHQTEAHDPLWAEGETLLGSVLEGTRRVSRGGSSWVVERTPDPIRFHPLTRYAMPHVLVRSVATVRARVRHLLMEIASAHRLAW